MNTGGRERAWRRSDARGVVEMDEIQRRVSIVPVDQPEFAPVSQTDEHEADVLERETRCGVGSWRPAWLQRLASKKSFVMVYGLIGMASFALGSYYVATISTMEKRFKIPSKTSGIISSAWDFGAVLSSLIVAYLGRRGHRTRWVAWGTVLVSLSCYMRLVPHWMYGPGEDALALTREFGALGSFRSHNSSQQQDGPKMTLCGNNHTETEDCDHMSLGHTSAVILFLAHMTTGIGKSVYYTLGISYMDDNARKNKAPMLLAIWQSLRMLGPTFGYLLASYALEMYVAPELTPTIDKNDPRWIGAWWFGWSPLGLVTILLALLMYMFPRSLPRTAQRNMATAAAKGQVYNPQSENQISIADFKITMKRLLRNKILVCNCISTTCFMFGLIGQWIFMPKYIETMFHQSASTASLISGSVGLVCSAAGVLVSAAVISRFKPRSRLLAGWNVLVEMCDVLGFIIIACLSCETLNLQGTPQEDGTLGLNVECNANCGCGQTMRYAPVCDPTTRTTFFSACHAGCATASWLSDNSSAKSFSSCACVEGQGSVVDGSCPVDCSQAFMFYIIVQCVQRFLSSTGRAGNTIIHFRCVTPEDKPVSLGLSEIIFCTFAFVPGPIIFGLLIVYSWIRSEVATMYFARNQPNYWFPGTDMSCMVWGYTCGETGNCLLYDVDKLRLYVNLPVVLLLFIGTLWDVGVWYHVKGLELYDDVEDEKKKEPDETNEPLNDNEPNYKQCSEPEDQLSKC